MAPKLIDYSLLNRKRVYKLADVQSKIEKVAWDMVRFIDNDNIDDLWKIERCADGDYIVATYDEEPKIATASVKNEWAAIPQKEEVQIFYKKTPVIRLNLNSLGIPNSEASLMQSYLPKKLASSKELVNKMLNQLSSEEKDSLYKQFPELV